MEVVILLMVHMVIDIDIDNIIWNEWKTKRNRYLKSYILLFRWHDQYEKYWPKQNQGRWKSYRNILISHIEYVTVKELSYATTNSVKPLYLIISQVSGYIEEKNGNR